MVEEAPEVVEGMHRFWEVAISGDLARFDDVVADADTSTMIGTSEREFFDGRDLLRQAMGNEGVTIDAADLRGFREGDVGWVQGRPRFVLPDGAAMRTRFTGVLLNQDGAWKLVQGHFSVAVPDEEVLELQARWSAGS